MRMMMVMVEQESKRREKFRAWGGGVKVLKVSNGTKSMTL